MNNEQTEEQMERIAAYQVGHYFGWHAEGKAQTIDILPKEYKDGPLAVEFAIGYKDGFDAWKGCK